MIIWPIFWFFGLVAIIALAAAVTASAIVLFLTVRRRKRTPTRLNGIAAIVMTMVLAFVSVYSGTTGLNIWHWMSELSEPNIIEDDGELAMRETDEIWYNYRPFGNDTRTISADFESDLIITRNYPRLDGATAFLPVYSAVAETIYSELNSDDVPKYIQLSTTSQAFERLTQRETDIIFTLQPSQAQIEDAKQYGVEFIKTPIFSEAFVFFVNEANPIDSLTTEQIRQIYTGEITNWKDVGGQDEEIVAYQRNANSGSQTTMEQVVMRGFTMAKPETELYHGFMGSILRGVAQYDNHERALGYSFRFYSTVINPHYGLKLLSVDGIEPTPENIANNSYPFTVNVYAITTEQGLKNPNTQAVIDWLVSPQGQQLIEQTGYVGLETS